MRRHMLLVALLLLVVTAGALQVNAGNYNRNGAVAYADRWAHDHNPDYPNREPADCTNYVSQVLHNGGLPLIVGWDDIWHWYYVGTIFTSNTWANADHLNQHASQFQGDRFEFRNPPNLEPGDFFLMDLPDDRVGPDHARVFVGWGRIEEGDEIGTNNWLANQHSVDRKRVRWNLNIPAGTPLWGWHVVW